MNYCAYCGQLIFYGYVHTCQFIMPYRGSYTSDSVSTVTPPKFITYLGYTYIIEYPVPVTSDKDKK